MFGLKKLELIIQKTINKQRIKLWTILLIAQPRTSYFPACYYGRGSTYEKLGEYALAFDDYDKTIEKALDESWNKSVKDKKEYLFEQHPELKP